MVTLEINKKYMVVYINQQGKIGEDSEVNPKFEKY